MIVRLAIYSLPGVNQRAQPGVNQLYCVGFSCAIVDLDVSEFSVHTELDDELHQCAHLGHNFGQALNGSQLVMVCTNFVGFHEVRPCFLRVGVVFNTLCASPIIFPVTDQAPSTSTISSAKSGDFVWQRQKACCPHPDV